MSTILVLLTMLFVLALCGVGPSLLLLPRGETGLRVLSVLPLGLSTGVVASMSLAWFGLPGRAIATVIIALFAVLGAIGVWARPPTRIELMRAAAPLAIATSGTLLVTWPLLQATHYRYIGYGNPDVPALLQQAMYLDGHPFGMYREVPAWTATFYQGVQPQLTLGMLYFFSMVSVLTGSPIHTLFGVACAAIVFMVPVTVFLLAEDGFRLPRSVALLAGVGAAGSSMLAYTFYLHSLGTLTTMAMVPAALVFMARCLETPTPGRILLMALIWVGMYYNYHAGAGFVGLSLAALTVHELSRRPAAVRPAVAVAVACVALTLATFLPHGLDILRILRLEVTGGRRLAWTDEIQGFFGLALTEHLVPYLWGLKLLTQPPATLVDGRGALFLVVGLSCVAVVILACSNRVSRLPGSYAWIMATVLLLLVLYTARGVGYGVFKLAAWAHPLLWLGLVAGALGLSDRLRRWIGPVAGAAPLALPAGVFAWNVFQTVVLSTYLPVQITTGITMDDYAQLRGTAGLTEDRRIVATLADPVMQLWVEPFLPETRLEFLPALTLAVEDSWPRARADLARFVPTPGGRDDVVVLHQVTHRDHTAWSPSPLWQNHVFALSSFPTLRDVLVFGRGWYRVEESEDSPFPFVRRFRWLRKRAELLVLNAQGEAHRLRIKLTAGFGNPEPARRLRLFHNGVQIEEIRFLAYAQLYTRPFRLDHPLEQLELEVVGDARPLLSPRRLWNRWVPQDPRSLNVGVAGVELVTGTGSRAHNSQIDFTDRVQVVDGTFEGIYRDRWMGQAASVTLRAPPDAQAIELRGTAPATAALPYPFPIRLSANGASVGIASIAKAGDFEVIVPIDESVRSRLPAGTEVNLTLEAAATFSGLDPRSLSIRLRSIGLTRTP